MTSTALAPHTNNTATEALLICCALAWHGNPLTGLDCNRTLVQRTITIAHHTYTARQILAWRTHTTPASWAIRWRWAHAVTTKHFAHAPGLNDLPHDHHDLPAVYTSTPTV
jgi:hypothetical protein